jgi:serine/threonine protein kinase HipA of HipAB toxin-antitoxin module
MLNWFNAHKQRKQIRQDRKLLEIRARRLLNGYLVADGPRKQRFYQVIAGAAAAFSPVISDPELESSQLAQDTAEAAIEVVKQRELKKMDGDELQSMITDAYATVAVAYRRAAAFYTTDKEMLRLGTAAVHLVTMATSVKRKSDTEP